MERRAEARLPWNAPIRITVLSSPPRHYDAVLVNVSGRGARLRLNQPLDCDLPVRIDLENALLLGEVCYCATDGDAYGVGILLEHSLLNLAEVVRMRDQILAGNSDRTPAAQSRA
ncbi:MAG: PilZ domain-containing protein [Bryobacterales bacterium]|nr:PilZ domain-containing protein [Bryobacterales bacterium]